MRVWFALGMSISCCLSHFSSRLVANKNVVSEAIWALHFKLIFKEWFTEGFMYVLISLVLYRVVLGLEVGVDRGARTLLTVLVQETCRGRRKQLTWLDTLSLKHT